MVSERLGAQADSALSWISGHAPHQGPQEFRTVPVQEIHEHEYFRLREAPYPGVDALAADIKARGQTTPLFVRPRAAGGYDLVAGYRRRSAILKAELLTALVRVYPNLGDEEALDLAVSENRDREDVNDWERAELAQRLQKRGRTYEGIAQVLKLSDAQVKRLLRVAKQASPPLRTALQLRRVTLALATAFLELQVEGCPVEVQEEILTEAVDQECSVREFRRLVNRRLASTPPPRVQHTGFLREQKNGAFSLSLKVVPGDAAAIDERIAALQEALKRARKLRKTAGLEAGEAAESGDE